jgi:hypothetical protein
LCHHSEEDVEDQRMFHLANAQEGAGEPNYFACAAGVPDFAASAVLKSIYEIPLYNSAMLLSVFLNKTKEIYADFFTYCYQPRTMLTVSW